MSIIVKNNFAYLINKCKKSKLLIYTLNEDGTINITPTFNILWEAFYNERPYKTNPQCTTLAYTLPSFTTTLSGVKNSINDYVNFKRLSPTNPESATQSAITNEGFALESYYSGSGKRLNFQFSYSITDDHNPCPVVNVYALIRSSARPNRIVLFVDNDGNLSTYKGLANTFTTVQKTLIYFEYTGPGVMVLNVTALPSDIYACVPKSPKCLKIKECGTVYSSELYEIIKTLGMFQNIPYPQWRNIANLIQQTITLTSKPIPLGPITETGGPEITLIGANGVEFNLNLHPNPGIVGESGIELWSQFGTLVVPRDPHIIYQGEPVFFNDSQDNLFFYYYSIVPIKIDIGPDGNIVSFVRTGLIDTSIVINFVLEAALTIETTDTVIAGIIHMEGANSEYYPDLTQPTGLSAQTFNVNPSIDNNLSTVPFKISNTSDIGVYIVTSAKNLNRRGNFNVYVTYINP